jgi:hypothetical protein
LLKGYTINDKIFISYAKNDHDTAFKICETIEREGLKCWIAPRDIIPGENWGKAIINGINNCRLMVMIFSENSNDSVQVLREIERAVSKKIPIIIFRISDINPSTEFEYYVSTVHWLDAVGSPIEKHIENLKGVVKGYFINVNGITSDETIVEGPKQSKKEDVIT